MRKITRRAFAASSVAAAAATALGLKPASAQAYPARPVTVIVPWGAGGGTDATARIVAALLEKELGQPFNVPPPEKADKYNEWGIGGIIRMDRDGKNREV